MEYDKGGQNPDSKSTYWGAGGAGNMIRGTEPRFYKYILGGASPDSTSTYWYAPSTRT